MVAMSRFRNLTQIEYPSLARGILNFADAHARHSLSKASRELLGSSFDALMGNHSEDYFEAEDMFLDGISKHTGQTPQNISTSITYSASIALDIAAKYLAPRQSSVGMITPAFDSVAALFIRSGLNLIPVPEQRLTPECDFDYLDSLGLTALVLITPNNPTGARLSRKGIRNLIEWSARNEVVLILDLSFRMFDTQSQGNLIAIGEELGAQLITVDDTGKTIPLFDTKLGVLSMTSRLAPEIRNIYSDILLNVSELDLRLLSAVLLADDGNEVVAARDLAISNHYLLTRDPRLERALHRGRPTEAPDFQPSVAWLDIGDHRDLVLDGCHARSMQMLPGNGFFWDRPDSVSAGPGARWIRLPLLRDPEYFARGAKILSSVLSEIVAMKETD